MSDDSYVQAVIFVKQQAKGGEKSGLTSEIYPNSTSRGTTIRTRVFPF